MGKFIKSSNFCVNFSLILCLSIATFACGKSPSELAVSENSLKRRLSQPSKPSIDRICSIKFPSGICAEFHWVNLPPNTVPSGTNEHSFKLIFFDETSQSNILFGETLSVDLWMPSMNHGSAPVKIQQTSESEILVSKVYFIMSGDWVIRFKQNAKIFFEYPLEIL